MANIKSVRIIADVPFNWLNWGPGGVGLPDEDIAAVASALMSPSGGLAYEYTELGYVPNDHGGQTAMYRLSIFGEEALPWPFLERMARILKAAGPLTAESAERLAEIFDPGDPLWAESKVTPDSLAESARHDRAMAARYREGSTDASQ